MARERTASQDSKGSRDRRTQREIELGAREVISALSAETRRCVARANEQAILLENIAGDAVDAIGDIHGGDRAEELARRAHRLRGVVLNALVVLSEFQLVAGKLDALASIQQVTEQLEPQPE